MFCARFVCTCVCELTSRGIGPSLCTRRFSSKVTVTCPMWLVGEGVTSLNWGKEDMEKSTGLGEEVIIMAFGRSREIRQDDEVCS